MESYNTLAFDLRMYASAESCSIPQQVGLGKPELFRSMQP